MGVIEELETDKYLIPVCLLLYWYIQNMAMDQYSKVGLCDYEDITLQNT